MAPARNITFVVGSIMTTIGFVGFDYWSGKSTIPLVALGLMLLIGSFGNVANRVGE